MEGTHINTSALANKYKDLDPKSRSTEFSWRVVRELLQNCMDQCHSRHAAATCRLLQTEYKHSHVVEWLLHTVSVLGYTPMSALELLSLFIVSANSLHAMLLDPHPCPDGPFEGDECSVTVVVDGKPTVVKAPAEAPLLVALWSEPDTTPSADRFVLFDDDKQLLPASTPMRELHNRTVTLGKKPMLWSAYGDGAKLVQLAEEFALLLLKGDEVLVYVANKQTLCMQRGTMDTIDKKMEDAGDFASTTMGRLLKANCVGSVKEKLEALLQVQSYQVKTVREAMQDSEAFVACYLFGEDVDFKPADFRRRWAHSVKDEGQPSGRGAQPVLPMCPTMVMPKPTEQEKMEDSLCPIVAEQLGFKIASETFEMYGGTVTVSAYFIKAEVQYGKIDAAFKANLYLRNILRVLFYRKGFGSFQLGLQSSKFKFDTCTPSKVSDAKVRVIFELSFRNIDEPSRLLHTSKDNLDKAVVNEIAEKIKELMPSVVGVKALLDTHGRVFNDLLLCKRPRLEYGGAALAVPSTQGQRRSARVENRKDASELPQRKAVEDGEQVEADGERVEAVEDGEQVEAVEDAEQAEGGSPTRKRASGGDPAEGKSSKKRRTSTNSVVATAKATADLKTQFRDNFRHCFTTPTVEEYQEWIELCREKRQLLFVDPHSGFVFFTAGGDTVKVDHTTVPALEPYKLVEFDQHDQPLHGEWRGLYDEVVAVAVYVPQLENGEDNVNKARTIYTAYVQDKELGLDDMEWFFEYFKGVDGVVKLFSDNVGGYAQCEYSGWSVVP